LEYPILFQNQNNFILKATLNLISKENKY